MVLEKNPRVVIGISGPIGVGKSTFVKAAVSDDYQPIFQKLLEEFPEFPQHVGAYEESFDQNLLGLAEGDSKYSFAFQASMVIGSVTLEGKIAQVGGLAFLDRTIYEHMRVFARFKQERGEIMPWDYTLYEALAKRLAQDVPPPSAYIWLKADVDKLKGRIAKRGRPEEKWLLKEDETYLVDLLSAYDRWFREEVQQPVIEVDTNGVNVEGNGALDHEFFKRVFPRIARQIRELKIIRQ